jgi:hypothetical protein
MIQTYNDPFPRIENEGDMVSKGQRIGFSMITVLYLCLIQWNYSMHLTVEIINEREVSIWKIFGSLLLLFQLLLFYSFIDIFFNNKVKDMLRICGVSFECYRFTTFVFHSIFMSFNTFVVLMLSIYFIKLDFLQTTESMICISIIFLLSIPTLLLSNYAFTQLFDIKVAATSVLPLAWLTLSL